MNRHNAALKQTEFIVELTNQQQQEVAQKLSLAIDTYQATRSEKLSMEEVGSLHDESLRLATAVLELAPLNIEALNLLVRVELDRNNIELATELCQATLAIDPESATTWYSLGQIELAKGHLKQADHAFVKCISLDSTFYRAHTSYAYTKLLQGELAIAFQQYQKLVKIRPDDTHIREKLFECMRQLQADYDNKQLSQNIVDYYQWEDVNHSDLEKLTSSLLVHRYRLDKADSQVDIQKLCSDTLYNTSLRKIFFCNKHIEELNTDLRSYFLSLDVFFIADSEVNLMISLAMQAHNNEYVLFTTDAEEEVLNSINDLSSCTTQQLQDHQLIILKALLYRPLNKILSHSQIADINNGPQRPWLPGIITLIKILYSNENFQISDKIQTFSEITNTTSCAVRDQYEINPYPRWLSLGYNTATSYKMALERSLPGYTASNDIDKEPLEILIAGCGTGKHALQVARYFRSVKVTAVDISLHSLSYAVEMAEKYGIENIEFMQADILELGSIDKKFDVIECSGVLHHMEDPLAGAQVLKQLLNKDGVLKIGLYSERARHEVVGCREVIKNTYAETNTKVIQNFRHELLKNSEDFSQIMQSADFFSMSGCRDLLFHVKEHRYTPKTLSVFINNLGMEFLGFVQVPAQYQTSFMESFPLDKRRLDLNNWELFEENNPLIFSGMYQFYLTNA